MPGEDIIIMRGRELKRLHVIYKLNEKKINQQEASELLGLCVRQVRRISKRVLKEGDTGIVHKSRGKPSNRLFSEDLKSRAISLYRGRYSDFGPTLANEKMEDIEGIKVSTQTLRNWLIGEGLWKQKRRHRKHRQWRERKRHFGEMLQMDGSHHDWFEGRGTKLVLMAYIDDATSKVYARFYDYEGTLPAMDSFKGYIGQYGIPQCIYLDRHSTYKSTAKPTIEDELNNRVPMSQFERSMEEIGVKVTHALSPQAKGRVERLFRTFQDRVIKEMRLKGISTKEGANEFLIDYLPIYNKRFSQNAANEEDLHMPLAEGTEIDSILCIKTKRALKNDFTISHERKLYQIEDKVTARHVIVEEKIDGSMVIKHKEQNLKFHKITSRPVKEKQKAALIYKPRKKYIPPKDHPWRKTFIDTPKRTFLNVLKEDISNCG